MRKKHIPTVWIYPHKWKWIAKLKEQLGEEEFPFLSEDEKDAQAKTLYEAENVRKSLSESSLEYLDTSSPDVTEDEILQYYARIITSVLIEQQKERIEKELMI